MYILTVSTYGLIYLCISICREYQVQCPSAQEVRQIVNMHLSEKEKLDNALPSCIVIGPFHVSIEGVKQNLSKKRKALATSMLDILAKNLRLQVDSVSALVNHACSTLEKERHLQPLKRI